MGFPGRRRARLRHCSAPAPAPAPAGDSRTTGGCDLPTAGGCRGCCGSPCCFWALLPDFGPDSVPGCRWSRAPGLAGRGLMRLRLVLNGPGVREHAAQKLRVYAGRWAPGTVRYRYVTLYLGGRAGAWSSWSECVAPRLGLLEEYNIIAAASTPGSPPLMAIRSRRGSSGPSAAPGASQRRAAARRATAASCRCRRPA